MRILYATYFFKIQFKSDNKQKTSQLASECEWEIFFVHTFDSIVCTGRMLEGYICYIKPECPDIPKMSRSGRDIFGLHAAHATRISNF